MAFTDHSDLFGAVHEEGINLVVRHVMRQRPLLFNYATAFFREHNDLLCVRIEADKKVTDAGNPLFKVQDPIPLLGAAVPIGLNWCFQLTDVQIDFHPGNVFNLPAELGQLPAQRVALHLKACFGLDCPPEDVIQEILPYIEILATAEQQPSLSSALTTHVPTRPAEGDEVIVLPTRELLCFCLEIFAVAHFEWGTIGDSAEQWLKVRLDGLEIVDLQPTPMENTIECYVKTMLRLGILPRVIVEIKKLVYIDIDEMLKGKDVEVEQQISLEPAPVPAAVPNNPAVEEDQLKAFINLVVEEV